MEHGNLATANFIFMTLLTGIYIRNTLVLLTLFMRLTCHVRRPCSAIVPVIER